MARTDGFGGTSECAHTGLLTYIIYEYYTRILTELSLLAVLFSFPRGMRTFRQPTSDKEQPLQTLGNTGLPGIYTSRVYSTNPADSPWQKRARLAHSTRRAF